LNIGACPAAEEEEEAVNTREYIISFLYTRLILLTDIISHSNGLEFCKPL
jgi:hypothetical protein